MTDNRKKLVFVLPEYDENTSTHFSHTLDLIQEVAKDTDLFLFIEYAKGKPQLDNVYCQKFHFPLLSFLERFFVFSWLRLRGYKNFYIHYSYWSGLIAGLITRLTRGKFFYWHCEAYQAYGSDRKCWDLRWKFLDDLPLKLCLKLCHFLVTGTESMANFYSCYFRVPIRKIRIVPNSINLDRFSTASIKKIPKQIVFVHWLAPRKGADLLPEIISKCLDRDNGLSFVIIGEGPLFDCLKNAFSDVPQVQMKGALPNEIAKKHIAESELLIMPSRQEGFPRIILESMACGTAFVATDVGGMKDIVDYKCSLVSVNDVYGFSSEVIKMISNSDAREKMVKSGSNRVKNFSHISVAKIFKNLFS